jgi:hypothetical protein
MYFNTLKAARARAKARSLRCDDAIYILRDEPGHGYYMLCTGEEWANDPYFENTPEYSVIDWYENGKRVA